LRADQEDSSRGHRAEYRQQARDDNVRHLRRAALVT
jgi:hypothetical protein